MLSHSVVLTTYATLEAGFRRMSYGIKRQGRTVKETSALHTIKWHRIVLDEGTATQRRKPYSYALLPPAHAIKDRSCNTARAVFAMKSSYKWALSGTPLQNRIGELYSLVRFLEVFPYSYYLCHECDCQELQWKFKGPGSLCECGHSAHKYDIRPWSRLFANLAIVGQPRI